MKYEKSKTVFTRSITSDGDKAKTYMYYRRIIAKPETTAVFFRSLFLSHTQEGFNDYKMVKKFKDCYLFESEYGIQLKTLEMLDDKFNRPETTKTQLK